jgi:hypothetical protein
MAEIKSTLDLIMERTKNLTMTDEEKKDLQLKELQGKANGLIQRFMDGLIDTEAFEDELTGNREDRPLILDIVKKEALKRIEPDGNNERILLLLHEVLGEDTKPLSRRIEAFMKDIRREMARHAKEALKMLQLKGIGGSAVMPNLEKDPSWQIWLASSRASFKDALIQI